VRILFDQGVPAPLRAHLPGHDIKTGELLSKAERRFDVLVTTDQKLRREQNLAGRPFGVIVLLTTSWPVLQKKVDEIAKAVAQVQPGQCLDV
jgi:hypothetical protein